MPSTIVCSGTVLPLVVGREPGVNVAHCDTRWEVIPYVEPTDTTALYGQLVALNEFDPLKIAGMVTFCLVLFIVGFGAGMVINYLRRL